MRKAGEPWCSKLEPINIDWTNMLVEKEDKWILAHILIDYTELVQWCLQCDDCKKCDKKHDNIVYLDNNNRETTEVPVDEDVAE